MLLERFCHYGAEKCLQPDLLRHDCPGHSIPGLMECQDKGVPLHVHRYMARLTSAAVAALACDPAKQWSLQMLKSSAPLSTACQLTLSGFRPCPATQCMVLQALRCPL